MQLSLQAAATEVAGSDAPRIRAGRVARISVLIFATVTDMAPFH
jgi:hypothetical protein